MSINQFANVPFIKDLGNELLNSIGTVVNKATNKAEEDLKLYQRKNLDFRQIIDAKFPSLLIIDYNSIRNELKKYQNIPKSLKEIIGSDYEPIESDYNEIQFGLEESQLILEIIRAAVDDLSLETKGQTSVALQNKLQTIISNSQPGQLLKNVGNLFNDVIELTDLSTANRKYFIFPTFDSIRNIFAPILDANTKDKIKKNKGFENLSLGKALNFGHTSTIYKSGPDEYKLQFNSPKLLQIIFDVINDSNAGPDPVQKVNQATTQFLQETRQTEISIEITKDFSDGFMTLFVFVGGNVVTFENAVINQRKGSILEKRVKLGLPKQVLTKLAQQFKNLGRTTLGVEIINRLSKGRGSPSALDYILYNIVQNIKGEPVQKFAQKRTKNSKSKTTKTTPVLSGFIKPKVKKDILPRKPKQKVKSSPTPLVADESNLSNLQNIINSLLHQKIRQNMGNGDRTDVLNYRTGRFAESAQVERLTQGREGMITAYYNYMKYPYATFSAGGRQEFPRSRDPKLLISKSIREIMQEQMITRMRAVLV
jgi:hypothetical protein